MLCGVADVYNVMFLALVACCVLLACLPAMRLSAPNSICCKYSQRQTSGAAEAATGRGRAVNIFIRAIIGSPLRGLAYPTHHLANDLSAHISYAQPTTTAAPCSFKRLLFTPTHEAQPITRQIALSYSTI